MLQQAVLYAYEITVDTVYATNVMGTKLLLICV